MRYPQLVIHETDGTLARGLAGLVEARRWVLRQPKRVDSCIRLLSSGQPCVLVVRAGRDMTREMTLLERSRWLCPEAPVVVVSEPENIPLNSLAWHLGAACVLGPKQIPDMLPGVVTGLMERAAHARPQAASPRPPLGDTPDSREDDEDA